MNTSIIRQIFQSKFDYPTYCNEIVHNVFGCNDISTHPELLDTTADGDNSYYIGRQTDADGRELGFFYTRVAQGSDVRRKRVGLRKMIAPYLKYDVDAAIAVFVDENHWRLSYICDMKEGVTNAKRFSYILGDEQGQYKTPLERLDTIYAKKGRLVLNDLREAFSVDALSDEFFDEYHIHYDRIVAELAQQGKTGAVYHDYVKKLMGRIVFLHFLQKKGWLFGDTNFMLNTFSQSTRRSDYLESVLEPLFFGILNTEPDKREQVFSRNGWQQGLVEKWATIPYLNGGLFERDEVDNLRIVLPESIFSNLFSFLASYNFTVDENDPDDAEIGVDPEMLGKIFESLLEDNKAKGAFYTPKEIVRYMCKESLIAHLASKLPDVAEGVVRAFVESHEMQPELEPYRDTLSKALREVKICDPAIGSGAFPMGLLNELWRCREALGSQMSRLQLKKEIIESNIYGVDIERGAIDIARLRFWLSIVVDSEKAEPLPNFDYKFMQGNSLIESYGGFDLSRIAGKTVGRPSTSTQYVIGLDSDLSQKNLQRLLREYFSVTDHQKKATMRHAINAEVKTLIRESVGGTPTFLAQLEQLDPSANQDFFLWHTWFKDIFDKGGFDIVIGNPPYVVVEANGKYRNYETESSLDLYAYFYERAVKLLKSDGIISFITSSLFVKGLKYTSLRSFLENNVSVVAFRIEGDAVFENAGIPTATFIAQKARGKWKFEDFYADKKMVDKIKRGGTPLSTISDIMRGFEIGRNMVSSDGPIKFLTGSDVIKYTYYKLSYISQSVLSAFSKEKRFFTKERILLRETGSSLTAVYLGDETIYSNRSLYSILITKPELKTKYVLALLNSSLLQWYYATMFKGDTELFPKIRIAQAKQLPIFKASMEQQQPIIELVDRILEKKRSNPNADTSASEREIDRLVYKLYNLTDEEIAVIEQGN